MHHKPLSSCANTYFTLIQSYQTTTLNQCQPNMSSDSNLVFYVLSLEDLKGLIMSLTNL